MISKTARTMTMSAMLGVVVMHGLPMLAAPLPVAPTRLADPTAEEVMADAVKAMGGKDAIAKIKTLRSVMEMTVPGPNGDMKVEIETLWSRDGGRIVRQNTVMGGTELGTDGKATWKKTVMGVGTLSKEEAEQLKGRSSMIMHLLEPEMMREEIAKIDHAGTATFDGQECHRLHFAKNNGEEGDLFYDVKTALPAGIDKLGTPKSHVAFSDWQDEQGVKFYRTMKVEATGQPAAITMKVTKVEINTLDASAFAPPNDAGPASTSGPTAPKPDSGSAVGGAISLNDLTPEQQKKAQDTIDTMKKSGDAQRMKDAIARLEPMINGMPEDQRKMLQYIVQEMKKEIARLGG